MPESRASIAAVHYYYLLKDEEDALRQIWSGLALKTGDAAAPKAALDMAPSGGEPASRCTVVHRVEGTDLDLCLAMLPDLAVVEAIYRERGQGASHRLWPAALKRIETDRDKALAGGIPVFGETTLLVAPGEPESELVPAAVAAAGARQALVSELRPELAGGGSPLLVNLPGPGGEARGYFALAAAEADEILSTAFPEADSAIKKLNHSVPYFGQQRTTIAGERAEVDRQVGSLLHRRVVAGKGADKQADKLEQQIASLSKMYGVLATDSLLMQQAGDRLAADMQLLNRAFEFLLSREAGARNEIGEHYLAVFGSERGAVQSEAQSLNSSRENTKAAIEIVRTEVELLRAGEDAAIQSQTKELLLRSLTLQQERMALRVAATFVEFVLVFYYILKSWEGIVGVATFERIPSSLRLAVVAAIAGGTAAGTHFVAQAVQRRSWRNIAILTAVAVVAFTLATLTMVVATMRAS